MTWFKVDDSFYDHPKVFDAPDCAVALWTRAGAWSARNLTDGFVPSGMPARLCDDPDTAVKELVRRGLWKRTNGGYRFHDWLVYQPDGESVRSLREKRAAAGRRGGEARAAARRAASKTGLLEPNPDFASRNGPQEPPSANGPSSTPATHNDLGLSSKPPSKPVASASPVAKQNATPSRPVPKGRVGTVDLEGERSVTRAAENPPPRCPRHLEDPNPPPCGPCADARRAHDRWAAERRERVDAAPKCRIHRGQLAHNCGPCRADRLAAADEPPGAA